MEDRLLHAIDDLQRALTRQPATGEHVLLDRFEDSGGSIIVEAESGVQGYSGPWAVAEDGKVVLHDRDAEGNRGDYVIFEPETLALALLPIIRQAIEQKGAQG